MPEIVRKNGKETERTVKGNPTLREKFTIRKTYRLLLLFHAQRQRVSGEGSFFEVLDLSDHISSDWPYIFQDEELNH